MSVNGAKAIEAALTRHKLKSVKGLRAGLFRAGLFLQRESQKLVPVDTGILRQSANTRAEGSGFDVAVVVSYGTDYALYVHENLEAQHVPGKSAKFLETPFREKQKKMVAIIMKSLK
jgi:hypothetical protein